MTNPRDPNGLRIFSGRNSRELAGSACHAIGHELGVARTQLFPDGELLVRIDEDVRGKDCFVVISTCKPVNDNLTELLIFCDCLLRASASRVTIVTPYFGYARQDRKDQGRVPITAKLVANLIAAAGAHRVLAFDFHAAQIQGFFDLPVDHLSAAPVLVEHFMAMREELGDLCLVSPDVGNVKVAENFANYLHGDLAFINKRRVSGSEVTTGHLIGSVKGKTVLMVDDMISTAGTICEAAKFVMDQGANRVLAAATHGLFSGSAVERLSASPIERIVVTNTIPLPEGIEPIRERVEQLDIGPVLGEAMKRIHSNESVSALFKIKVGPKR